ncbi:prophage protein [Campylobacter hyointestinalis subsp. hyointestinalis]|uniref:Prophage protein n=2 Tax=Campylobacter hyointestinalis TaxID=198 RepID=A0A9W5AVT7_CAMHY|nr:prophage protein [Campylobacter hyointestinalis subsp. hyointestinalis]
MFVLSQNKVNSFFFDDVISFFDNNDIRNASNIIIQGKSHLTHKIDFIISKSKTQNERLIKLINTPNKDNLKATLFTFNDLEDRVYNTDNIIIFNDNQKIVTDDLLEATKQYNIKSLLWSKKEDFKDYLAA